MKTTVLRRSELYRQVWERTLTSLGAEMGISDNGLKKICTRYDIPRPPSGFFLMKPDKREQYLRPLPNPDRDPEIQITSQQPDEDDRVEAEHLIVPSKASSAGETTIEAYLKYLKAEGFVDERGILSAPRRTIEAPIRVSQTKLRWSADRFISILSTLEANGIRVEFREDKDTDSRCPIHSINAHYERSVCSLRIEETTSRRPRPFTASELKEKAAADKRGWGFYRPNEWIYTPSGKPQLIYGYCSRKVLSEDPRPAVQSILKWLRAANKASIEREIAWRHEKAVRLWELRPRRHALWATRQRKLIHAEASKWEAAQALRRYVQAVQATESSRDISEWVRMANRLIDRTDPIASGSFAARAPLPKYEELKNLYSDEEFSFDDEY